MGTPYVLVVRCSVIDISTVLLWCNGGYVCLRL